MSSYAEERDSEVEVLQSIFSDDEIQRISDDELSIRVANDEDDRLPNHVLRLRVHYTTGYPDEIPGLAIEDEEGELGDDDRAVLLQALQDTGQESLGMAMVFTLASQLKDSLVQLLKRKGAAAAAAEAEASTRAEEAEAARNKGTPVTRESFLAWRKKFDAERARTAAKEEEDRLRAMPTKDREAHRQSASKSTGRELFELHRDLDTSDAAFAEEGAVEVDVRQYAREGPADEEDERTGIVLSDSD